jgi:predicted aconitase with swiveling domain
VTRVLVCHRGLGTTVRGIALVADDNFSARYDLDRERGIFSRPAHKLFGESYVDRILVLKTAKGGVASAWMLRDMVDRGLAPRALVFNTVNPILAQGAAFAGLPLVHRFEDGDVTALVNTGDCVEVMPAEGRLALLAKQTGA